MGKTRIRPEQAETLEVFDDQKVSGSGLEASSFTLEDFLGGAISQVNRLINTTTAGNDWFAGLTAPSTFEGGVARGVDVLNQDLHDFERKRLLTLQCSLVSVGVPSGQNFVVLGGSVLPGNTTAAIDATSLGTVVAVHSSFGAHSLDLVAGDSPLNPRNLLPIVATATRDAVLSSGRRVYGLLQSESATDGHILSASAPDRAQISFVRLNATATALEACPIADIENEFISYCYVERVALKDADEQTLLAGAYFDVFEGGAGSGTVRLRAVAVVTSAIAANVLIEGPGGPGSPNIDVDLLDYAALTFATDLEIYVNGVLQEGGPLLTSDHDVYPSLVTAEQAVGAFFAEFDLIIGDKIQMFVGGGGGGGGGGGAGGVNQQITLASNALVDVDATEVVIGGGHVDGSSGGTYVWEILGEYNDSGGTGNQDIEIRLYDMGADGAPTAGTLRSVLEITSLDTLDRVSLTLSPVTSPGTDTDEIHNVARMYEVRAFLDAGGGVDTALISSVEFGEVGGFLGGGVTDDGVTLQDAAFFTERADHVNTPGAGKGELWISSDAEQKFMFTDDEGDDQIVMGIVGAAAANSIPFGHASDGTAGRFTQSSAFGFLPGSPNLIFSNNGSALRMGEDSSGGTPGAGNGTYWVRDDTPSVPMFTGDTDVDIQLGRTYITMCSGGRFTGTTASSWYSLNAQAIWDQGSAATLAGTGTDPAMTHNFLGMYVPGPGTIITVTFHYSLNIASGDGKFVLYKARPTTATTTLVKTAVATADYSVEPNAISVSHLIERASLTEAVLTHDRLRLWHKNGATVQQTAANCGCSVLIELD